MRVFIGIDLPKEIKDYLFQLEKELNKLPIKCKFVAKKNLHITMKFIPSIRPNELEQVKEKLKQVKFPKFKMNLQNLDFFSNKDKNKVIWVGLEPKNKLFRLQQDIDARLLDVLKLNIQKFQAHITLGRIKLIKNKEKFSKEVKNIKVKNLEFDINSFQLYESTLTKDGPNYKLIENYNL